MQRLDQLLFQLGLVRSRQQAQELILNGYVKVNDVEIRKPSHKVNQDIEPRHIQILKNDFQKYVSRGGVKLQNACEHLKLKTQNLTVLDVGISTGGFTDYLLQSGCTRIVGLDVGKGQLAESLKLNSRLVCVEEINAREITPDWFASRALPELYDLVVVDVSFISLSAIIPSLVPLLSQAGNLLALVKPQFEVGPKQLGKGGIVKDKSLHFEIKEKTIKLCQNQGLEIKDYFDSGLLGTDGNQEFFLFAKKLSEK